MLILGFEELGRSMGGPLARQRNLAYVTFSARSLDAGWRYRRRARVRTSTSFKLQRQESGAEMELAESQTTPDPGPGPIPGALVGEEGEVVRYVAERGFGFIACSDREVFFHLSNVFDVQDVEIVPGLPVWFTSGSQDGKERATLVAGLGRPVCRSLLDRITRRRSLLSPLEIEASASCYRRSTGGSCCTSPCSSALLTTSRWVRASTSRWNREQTAGCVRQARF